MGYRRPRSRKPPEGNSSELGQKPVHLLLLRCKMVLRMNVDILATAIAVSDKLSFVSDPDSVSSISI